MSKKIKAKFKAFDTNGDGMLDVDELAVLLKKGKPDMTHREIKTLFAQVDKNGDGRIEFEEFVDYIYSAGAPAKKQQDAAEAAGCDWEEIKDAFYAFAGRNGEMESLEFARMCRDCGLFGNGFGASEVDVIFSTVCPQGKRALKKPQFRRAVNMIAEKKGMPGMAIRAKIAATGTPTLISTKPQETRLSRK